VHNGIGGKRNLLAEEMLRYFGETCPALVAREVAGRLRTLRAVTNETNRELATSRAAVTKGQASAEVLLDRALASIEHLSEVAQTMTRWMDGVISECLSAAV
jgi:hypothetical protein